MESSLIIFAIQAMVGFLVFIVGFIYVARIAWRFYEVKNCVEVIVIRVGQKFQQLMTYNCWKVKVLGEFEQYKLVTGNKKKSFVFYKEYAIRREKDGKTCVFFLEKEGKNIPFLVDCEINSIETTTKNEAGEDLTSTETTATTKIETEYLSKESMDNLVRDSLREDYDRYTKALDGKKKMNPVVLVLLLIAGSFIIGLIIFAIIKSRG